MAEHVYARDFTWEQWERSLAADPREAPFERKWYWIAAAILSWAAFWRIADRFAESPYAQVLAWLTIGTAVWVASNY